VGCYDSFALVCEVLDHLFKEIRGVIGELIALWRGVTDQVIKVSIPWAV